MRTAFIKTLCQLAKDDPSIFLICGDLGFSVVEPFAESFPDRFLNAGVAEQNMTGVAAGLAIEGYNVFTYSIGNFSTLRCLEQIRYDVCYHNLSVKVVAVGGGFAYGPLGASHHATEDLAIMRALPNMTVTAPGDPHETSAITQWMGTHRGPGYMRLNKAGDRSIHTTVAYPIQAGAPIQVIAGTDIAVFCTGGMLDPCEAFMRTADNKAALFSFPFVSPMNSKALTPLFKQYPRIITIEEHQSNGGFGSAIMECCGDAFARGEVTVMPSIKRIAIPNQFSSVAGSQHYLREQNNLTLAGLGF